MRNTRSSSRRTQKFITTPRFNNALGSAEHEVTRQRKQKQILHTYMSFFEGTTCSILDCSTLQVDIFAELCIQIGLQLR